MFGPKMSDKLKNFMLKDEKGNRSNKLLDEAHLVMIKAHTEFLKSKTNDPEIIKELDDICEKEVQFIQKLMKEDEDYRKTNG